MSDSAPIPLLPAAILIVRVIGLLMLLLGAWQLVSNLIDGWLEFDPTYLGYFFRSQLLRPLIAGGIGLVILIFSRPLGRTLCRGLNR